jgi:hypothetical protein
MLRDSSRRLARIAQVLFALALSSAVCGCRHNQGDSLVVTGDGTRLSSEAIDADPVALLPSGPIVMFWVDAPAFFASPFGTEIARVVTKDFPLGPEAGFSAARDIKKVVGGLYSMAGADIVAVVAGDFRPELIRAAAEQKAVGPTGKPLTHSQYAGNDLYTAGNVGFTVVTQHTMLVGNETGMRRSLDRIRDNRVKRDVAEWMVKLMDSPNASLVVAGDVASQPMVATAARQAPFLNGLSSFRIVGNFQSPGLNLAGALTYPDAAGAASGAASLRDLAQATSFLSLLAFFGISNPLRSMQAEVKDADVQFVMGIDAQSLTRLLGAF